mmetsp:Transcript_27191/g.50933  ORF Transcript_27191/g.50933 Transcript_27191/m.50933 type:complete len:235 (-) Transcript_27191:538-1242(-)
MPFSGNRFLDLSTSTRLAICRPACSSFASVPKVDRKASAGHRQRQSLGHPTLRGVALRPRLSGPCGSHAALRKRRQASSAQPQVAPRPAETVSRLPLTPSLGILCKRHLPDQGHHRPLAGEIHHKCHSLDSESPDTGPNPPHRAALGRTARRCSRTASYFSTTFCALLRSAEGRPLEGMKYTPHLPEQYLAAREGCGGRCLPRSRCHSPRRSATRMMTQSRQNSRVDLPNAQSS